MWGYVTACLGHIWQSLLAAAILGGGGWFTIRKLFPDKPTSVKCLAFIGGAAVVASVTPIQPVSELYVAVLAFGIIAVLDYLREKRGD